MGNLAHCSVTVLSCVPEYVQCAVEVDGMRSGEIRNLCLCTDIVVHQLLVRPVGAVESARHNHVGITAGQVLHHEEYVDESIMYGRRDAGSNRENMGTYGWRNTCALIVRAVSKSVNLAPKCVLNPVQDDGGR